MRLPAHPASITLRRHCYGKNQSGSAIEVHVASCPEQQTRGVRERQAMDVVCQQYAGNRGGADGYVAVARYDAAGRSRVCSGALSGALVSGACWLHGRVRCEIRAGIGRGLVHAAGR